MARRLSATKLEEIKRKGGVEVSKPKTKPKPSATELAIKKVKEEAEEAKRRAGAAEKAAAENAKLMLQQIKQMNELIRKIPSNEGAPRIVGFEFIRGEDGYATGVTFIRERKH